MAAPAQMPRHGAVPRFLQPRLHRQPANPHRVVPPLTLPPQVPNTRTEPGLSCTFHWFSDGTAPRLIKTCLLG